MNSEMVKYLPEKNLKLQTVTNWTNNPNYIFLCVALPGPVEFELEVLKQVIFC